MSGDKIFVGDNELDLNADTIIATTIQSFDASKIGTVRASYTNQLSIPLSKNNKIALRFPDEFSSTGLAPYSKSICKVIRSGIETLPSAQLEIIETDDNSIQINITGNIKGFFDSLDGKFLTDLNLNAINRQWTNADHDAVRTNITGLTCPIINGGQLLAGDNTTHGKAVLPVIQDDTIMSAIFALSGFKKAGSVFTDALYLAMATPCTLSYDKDWLRAKEFRASAPGTQSIVNVTATIQFNEVSDGSDGFFAANVYTVTNPDTALDYFAAGFYTQLNVTVVGGTITIRLKKGATVVSSAVGVGTGSYELLSVADINTYVNTANLKAGDVYSVEIITAGGAPTTTINSGVFYNNAFNSTSTVKAFEPAWYHYFEKLLPKIELKRWMYEFMTTFNLMAREKDGTVTFVSVDSMINDYTNTKDWSTKDNILYETNTIYKPNYGQVNYFKWAITDANLKDNFARGSFAISNQNLDVENTVISSEFAATETITRLNIQSAQLSYYSTATSLFTALDSIEARKVLLRAKYSFEPTVTFNGIARNDYKVAYFIDANQSLSLDWNKILARNYIYYPLLLASYKQITKRFNLNVVDIENFNPFYPVWYNGQRWIVNKIFDFIDGAPSKVELIKI